MSNDILRVGIDAREPLRAQPRGIGQYGCNVIRAMQQLDESAEFVLYHEEDLPADRTAQADFLGRARTSQIRSKGYRWRTWERLALPWRMAKDRLSVFHGIYNTIPPKWPLLRMPPMVISIHDIIVTWYDDDLQDEYVRYCRQATPRFVRQAARILTVSEFSRQDIATRYNVDPERIEVIHNGVHDDFRKPADPERVAAFRQNTTDGQPFIYAVGAHLERKNTAALIDILAELVKDRDLPHHLVITGLSEAQQAPFLQRAAAAGVSDRVHLLGYLDRRDLLAAFAGAELFIYPSLAEGWGVPVVEAMALGTPVVTSNTTAIPEAGGEYAMYFDPSDLGSMVEVTRRALDQPQWFAERQDAARERAQGFTWQNAARRMLEVYREVATGS